MILLKNKQFNIQINNKSSKLIPKTLFFIWIGDDVPSYVDFSINAFKKVNPKFNINFQHITIDTIEHRKNKIVDRCCEYIIDAADGKTNKYSIFINRYINENRKFCQILANVLRFELLYEYGGIYLDCDTFPIKPFDEKLLEAGSFCPQICSYRNKKINADTIDDAQLYDFQLKYDDNYHKYYNNDIFFIGQHKNYKDTIKFLEKTTIVNNINTGVYIRNNLNDPKFLHLRQKFFNCTLQIDQHYYGNNFYIDHFCDRTWQKNSIGIIRSPNCEFDYYLKNMNRKFCRRNEYASDCIFTEDRKFIFKPTDDDYIQEKYSTTTYKNLDYANELIKKFENGIKTIHNGIIPSIIYKI